MQCRLQLFNCPCLQPMQINMNGSWVCKTLVSCSLCESCSWHLLLGDADGRCKNGCKNGARTERIPQNGCHHRVPRGEQLDSKILLPDCYGRHGHSNIQFGVNNLEPRSIASSHMWSPTASHFCSWLWLQFKQAWFETPEFTTSRAQHRVGSGIQTTLQFLMFRICRFCRVNELLSGNQT